MAGSWVHGIMNPFVPLNLRWWAEIRRANGYPTDLIMDVDLRMDDYDFIKARSNLGRTKQYWWPRF
jgi:hypothetical protein